MKGVIAVKRNIIAILLMAALLVLSSVISTYAAEESRTPTATGADLVSAIA